MSAIDHADLLHNSRNCQLMRDFIAQFANPIRLKILCVLTDGPASVNSIVAAVEEKQSTVSQQLKHLYLAQMVSRRRQGNSIHYEIANPAVLRTMHFFKELSVQLQSSGGFSDVLGDGEAE